MADTAVCIIWLQQIIIVSLDYNSIWHLPLGLSAVSLLSSWRCRSAPMIFMHKGQGMFWVCVCVSGSSSDSSQSFFRLVLCLRFLNGESSAAKAVTKITPDAYQPCLSSSSAWLHAQHQKAIWSFQHTSTDISAEVLGNCRWTLSPQSCVHVQTVCALKGVFVCVCVWEFWKKQRVCRLLEKKVDENYPL